MAAVLDTLRFSQRRQQSGGSREQAEAHGEVAQDMVIAELVTKDDLLTTRNELLAAMREQELRITINLRAMLAAIAGPAFAGQRLL